MYQIRQLGKLFLTCREEWGSFLSPAKNKHSIFSCSINDENLSNSPFLYLSVGKCSRVRFHENEGKYFCPPYRFHTNTFLFENAIIKNTEGLAKRATTAATTTIANNRKWRERLNSPFLLSPTHKNVNLHLNFESVI